MMKKKPILIVLSVILLLSVLIFPHFIMPETATESNIFSEIYADELIYIQSASRPKILQLKDANLNTAPDTSDFKNGLVSVSYFNHRLPEDANIEVSSTKKGMTISLYIPLTEKVIFQLHEVYQPKNKTLLRRISFSDDGLSVSNDDIGEFRKRYSISDEKIESYFALIDETFLKDWAKSSSSSYSEKDYGHVKIIDQWKKE